MTYLESLDKAFNEGSDAWLSGLDMRSCPYKTAKREKWLAGWRHCERNYPRELLPASHRLRKQPA